MGNGPRISLDIETNSLTLDDIEKAAVQSAASFGKSNLILMGTNALSNLQSFFGYEEWPEYSGTPWAQYSKLTKRERAVAGLHTFLKEIGALKNIDEDEFKKIAHKSTRRLKRASWARYNKKKVQSPL